MGAAKHLIFSVREEHQTAALGSSCDLFSRNPSQRFQCKGQRQSGEGSLPQPDTSMLPVNVLLTSCIPVTSRFAIRQGEGVKIISWMKGESMHSNGSKPYVIDYEIS